MNAVCACLATGKWLCTTYVPDNCPITYPLVGTIIMIERMFGDGWVEVGGIAHPFSFGAIHRYGGEYAPEIGLEVGRSVRVRIGENGRVEKLVLASCF